MNHELTAIVSERVIDLPPSYDHQTSAVLKVSNKLYIVYLSVRPPIKKILSLNTQVA